MSDGNPFAEALFRTLKYRPGFPRKPFATLQALRPPIVTQVAPSQSSLDNDRSCRGVKAHPAPPVGEDSKLDGNGGSLPQPGDVDHRVAPLAVPIS